jgi:hypothetical protein
MHSGSNEGALAKQNPEKSLSVSVVLCGGRAERASKHHPEKWTAKRLSEANPGGNEFDLNCSARNPIAELREWMEEKRATRWDPETSIVAVDE